MTVLMISGDKDVLNPQSDAGKRMAEYREAFGELDILLAYGSFFKFMGAFFLGLRMLLQKKPDIITAQDAEHSLLAWIFSKLFRIPWQMQIHTDIFSLYFARESFLNRIRVGLAKFLVPRASCVRVVSQRIKRSLINFNKNLSSSDKIYVLPIFVDVEKIKNAPIKTDLHRKYPGRFIILMVSRITREKNIGLALEALAELVKELPPPLTPPPYEGGGDGEGVSPLLLIVGDGPELSRLKFQVSSFKLHDYVIFEPHTDDLISYYKTCDLFLLTSNYEGYGRTLIEAATAGAKIISSDVGIAPEILEPENIFKVGDKNDLAEKLKLAIAGQIKPSKPALPQTKAEYLKLYKESFEICTNKK